MENFLYKLTRPEIEEYLRKNDVVLFPVGSTEQHGKHMAIDNDAYTAHEIARRVAVKTGVLVAPVMPFGYSHHHMNFKGTMTLTFDTLVNVYKEACESLIHHGFKKIVIFNGHGGNTNPLVEAMSRVRDDTGVKLYAIMAFPNEKGFGAASYNVLKQEGGGHACEMETSIGLYLGQRILMDKTEKWTLPVNTPELEKKYKGRIYLPRNFDEVTEIGSLGDPTIATREKGMALVESLVNDIASFIEDLKTN